MRIWNIQNPDAGRDNLAPCAFDVLGLELQEHRPYKLVVIEGVLRPIGSTLAGCPPVTDGRKSQDLWIGVSGDLLITS